ncbi:transcription factor Zelda-like isoform X3 [Artemia franciscana]|uniref:transcription factor Zelda-like isoform X3 n=1 Tax=Artemia franciscana TaxID=6661 RepID=UPI0032DAE294
MTSENARSPKTVLPDDGRHIETSLNCDECGVAFESVQSLEVHRHYHQGNLLSRWALEHGPPTYSNGPEDRQNSFDTRLNSYHSHQNFQQHQNGLMSNGANFPCDRCGVILPSPYALSDHINIMHREVNEGYSIHPPPIREMPDSSSEILDLDSQRVHVYQPGQAPPPLISLGQNYQNSSATSGSSYGSSAWISSQFCVPTPQPPSSFSPVVGYPSNQTGVMLGPQMQHPNQQPPRWMQPSQGHRGFPSSIMIQGQMPTSTSSRDVRPKAFYCAACNKGFTSSGHLKRHYSTNIHQNAVKASGLPDPALQYPTRKKNKMKAADTTSLPQTSSSPAPGSPESSTSSGDVSGQFYEDSQGTPPATASQGLMSPGHFRQDFQSMPQQGQFHSSSQNSFKGNVGSTSNFSVTTSNSAGFTGTNGNGPSNFLGSNNSEFSQVTPFSTENTSTNSTTNGTNSTSMTVPASNQSPSNGPPSYSDLPHFQSQASQYTSGPTQPLRSLASFASGPIYPPFSSTYNQDVPNFSYSALPPNSQAPPSEGTRGAGPYDEASLGFNNNNTLDIGEKPMFGRASGSSDGESSTSVLSTHSEPASPERFPANIFLNSLTEADVSAITGGGEVKYRCSYCDKTFNRTCYLTQHCNSYHVGDRPFKCGICGKRFCDEENYKYHQSKHVGNKPYKCHQCPKQFNHKTDLNRHMCVHTGLKPYICRVCQKGFIRKDHMHKHIATHITQKRKIHSP